MRVFFVDDSGQRKPVQGQKPWFCFGAISVDASHVSELGHRLARLKKSWGLEPLPGDEIKFNQIGRAHDTRRKPNPLVRLGYDQDERTQFGLDALKTLSKVKSLKVFGVGVDVETLRRGEVGADWAWKLLTERFEYSMNDETNKCALAICDQEDADDEAMRQALLYGTEFTKLPSFPEPVMFVPSHLSPGVQFADLVAGAFGRWWNHRDDKYLQVLEPAIHRDAQGCWQAAGIKSFRQDDYPPL